MYRFIVVAVIFTVVLAELDTSMNKCLEVNTKGLTCCKSITKQVEEFKKTSAKIIHHETGNLKECLEIPLTQPCEILKCVGKKNGFVSEDGSVIKEALQKVFEEELQGATTFFEAAKNSCFKGNIADLDGAQEDCEILAIFNCINRQAAYHCMEWNDSDHCAGIGDLVKECVKLDS